MKIFRMINKWLQDRLALSNRNWKFYANQFPVLYQVTWMSALPIIGPILRYGAKLGSLKRHFTQGHVVPINTDLNFKRDSRGVILPIDLVRNAIKQSKQRTCIV